MPVYTREHKFFFEYIHVIILLIRSKIEELYNKYYESSKEAKKYIDNT
jgi:hypothetical protein